MSARPCGKAWFIEDKAFECGERKLKSGSRKEVDLTLTAFAYKFKICC